MDTKEKITCIACGYDFYMIVTDNGKTYSWGTNWCSQLGNSRLESTYDYTKVLCEVELSGKTIGNLFLKNTFYIYRCMDILKIYGCKPYMICLVKVACGSSHTIALTDKGKVYTWGGNKYKQSDPNREDWTVSPTMVNHKIIMTNRKTLKNHNNNKFYNR